MGAAIAIVVWLAGGTYVVYNVATYDAPVPQKCATFHERYDVKNRAFCDAWMKQHAVHEYERNVTQTSSG